jgi:hypothetical protein
MASFRDRTLPASLATGIVCGDQAQAFHECSGVIETSAVTKFSHCGDRHGALDTAPSRESGDHRVAAPRVDLVLEFLCETLETVGVFGDRSDICLADEGRSGCGTDDLCEPPEMGRAPGGPARIADILAQ